ncbi:MAG: ATP-binding protein [Clostridiales bacterium]|nr:ATP-binding protein [Clostridiales bacterium]
MPYKNSVYQKAINILQHRRDNAMLEAQRQTALAQQKIPELEDIQNKLSKIGLSISTLLFRSENPQAEIEKLKSDSLSLQKRKKELLVQNGFDEDALTVKYVCPFCADTGFIGERMCSCHRELLKEIERNELRKSAPVDRCTFENFDINYYPGEILENGISPREKAVKILESCRGYAQSFNLHSPSLLFMGGTGLGKTHLSLAIANVAINKGFSVIYGTSQNILSDLQNENFGRTDNIYYTEYDVLHTDLLIIDDLGTEFKSQYSVACLYNIINTRLLKRKPTVISTNFDFDDLERDYNQRITSRLSGEYSTLVLVGNDIRYIK